MKPQVLLMFCLALTVGRAASAQDAKIDVDQYIWGFGGPIVPNQFVPLSVQISNPTPNQWEGVLNLRRYQGAGSVTGARMSERVFVSQFSTRRVQFYPYVTNNQHSWR